jgi:hypothetical protein
MFLFGASHVETVPGWHRWVHEAVVRYDEAMAEGKARRQRMGLVLFGCLFLGFLFALPLSALASGGMSSWWGMDWLSWEWQRTGGRAAFVCFNMR